jgi:hypothetical protein
MVDSFQKSVGAIGRGNHGAMWFHPVAHEVADERIVVHDQHLNVMGMSLHL